MAAAVVKVVADLRRGSGRGKWRQGGREGGRGGEGGPMAKDTAIENGCGGGGCDGNELTDGRRKLLLPVAVASAVEENGMKAARD